MVAQHKAFSDKIRGDNVYKNISDDNSLSLDERLQVTQDVRNHRAATLFETLQMKCKYISDHAQDIVNNNIDSKAGLTLWLIQMTFINHNVQPMELKKFIDKRQNKLISDAKMSVLFDPNVPPIAISDYIKYRHKCIDDKYGKTVN